MGHDAAGTEENDRNLKVGQSCVKCRKQKKGGGGSKRKQLVQGWVGYGKWAQHKSVFFCFFPLRCLLILHIYGLSKTQEGQLDGGEDREMKLQTRGGMRKTKWQTALDFFCCFECETVELDELQVGFIECKPAAKAKICSRHIYACYAMLASK